uniref:Uncharacterized protein n=1 Tax=viral metagenome TaxID=1070528 RepID=A0A6M3JLR0_9ZZZZ
MERKLAMDPKRILKIGFPIAVIILLALFAIAVLSTSCSYIGQDTKTDPIVQTQPVTPQKVEVLPVFKEAKEKALNGSLVRGNLRASCKEMGPEKKCLIVDIKEMVIVLTKAEGPMLQVLYFNEITGEYLIELYFARELIGQEVLTKETANEVAIEMMIEFEAFVDGGIPI